MKPLFWGNSETVNHVQKALKKGEVVLARGRYRIWVF